VLKRLVIALLAMAVAQAAAAGELGAIALDTGPTGTRAELLLDGAGEYRVLNLSGPDRLVVDLPATRLGKGFKLPRPTGIVRAVRSGQPEPGIVRIVFDLAAPVVALKPHMEPAGTGSRLVLEWPDDGTEPGVRALAAKPSVVAPNRPAVDELASPSPFPTPLEPAPPMATSVAPAMRPVPPLTAA